MLHQRGSLATLPAQNIFCAANPGKAGNGLCGDGGCVPTTPYISSERRPRDDGRSVCRALTHTQHAYTTRIHNTFHTGHLGGHSSDRARNVGQTSELGRGTGAQGFLNQASKWNSSRLRMVTQRRVKPKHKWKIRKSSSAQKKTKTNTRGEVREIIASRARTEQHGPRALEGCPHQEPDSTPESQTATSSSSSSSENTDFKTNVSPALNCVFRSTLMTVVRRLG